ELGSPRCLAQTVHQEVEYVRVETVVDLLDAGQEWRGRVVEEREEGQRSNGAVGGLGQGGLAREALLPEDNNDALLRAAKLLERDLREPGDHFPRVCLQAGEGGFVLGELDQEGAQV